MRWLDYKFARLVKENRTLRRELADARQSNRHLWDRATTAERAVRNLEARTLSNPGHR